MARNWRRKIFSRFNPSKKEANPKTKLPISEWQPIASRRQFTITPSASTTALDPSNAANSPFFRLPRELQLQILKYAFGNRIFHIELTPDEPQRLIGYICPRSSVEHGNFRQDIIKDDCFWKRNLINGVYNIEKDPRRATVGALGWLTSCRKAYAIGIDVLYASNTFFLEQRDTVLHLDKFILPQRSHIITRVEMIWMLEGMISDGETLQDLRAHLAIPTQVFSSIKDLRISFNWKVFDLMDLNTLIKPSTFSVVDKQFLQLLDSMVRDLPPTAKEVNIAIPLHTFSVTAGKANVSGATFDETSPRFDFRIRRPLPPAKWNDGISEPGYWLTESGFQPIERLVCHYPVM